MNHDKEEIKKVVGFLKKGGVVIYPTETAYAIGCDATHQKAVAAIFKIKKRSQKMTLPLIVGNLTMAKKWAVFNKAARVLAKKFWPGALTLVLPAKKKLAPGCVAKDKTIALRVSGNVWARRLSQKLGAPLVSTSANLSGDREIYSIKELRGIKRDKIYLLDRGKLPRRLPSTIVKIEKDGAVKVLRQGEIRIMNNES